LNARDILLLGLSGALDLFEEIKDPLSIFSKSYESMYGWVPKKYKRHNFNHLIWRSIKTGYIEKIEKQGEIYLRLTSAGSKKIVRDFPLLAFQNKKWDKKWRVVVFDIEEEDRQARERFRGKLKELGFGMLQESVFISPYDITQDFTEFIGAQHLSESAYLLEVSSIAVGDIKSLVNKVWHLDQINEMYKKIIEKVKENHLIIYSGRLNKLNKDSGNKVKDGVIKDMTIKDRAIEIKRAYLEVVLRDPFLPKELLPSDWLGYEAKKLIKNL
ncbi:MAG: CRISPR-associated endonuclease Cas2, partial [Candidatus Daviesbacteria bacterium]|nr:CRISPR-associated endonuclease Cas2 [Candidatus Daviesbacteria bacterium]